MPKSPHLRRPIIASMLRRNGGPLNVRVQDRPFFHELIDARPSDVTLMVERKEGIEDLGSSSVQYESAQQGTGLPRIQLLAAHREWILQVYGKNPVGEDLVIERGDEPFLYILRVPSRLGK